MVSPTSLVDAALGAEPTEASGLSATSGSETELMLRLPPPFLLPLDVRRGRSGKRQRPIRVLEQRQRSLGSKHTVHLPQLAQTPDALLEFTRLGGLAWLVELVLVAVSDNTDWPSRLIRVASAGFAPERCYRFQALLSTGETLMTYMTHLGGRTRTLMACR